MEKEIRELGNINKEHDKKIKASDDIQRECTVARGEKKALTVESVRGTGQEGSSSEVLETGQQR